MIHPTIHLNGTSPERLTTDWRNAADSIHEAYEALKKCAPNGRDYYPQGPNALPQASEEHMDRLRRLDSVIEELAALCERAIS